MKHDMYELPESLYEFAQINDFHGVIEDLAAMAEDEDWNYHNTTSTSNLPILENYIRNTYIRLSREKKVAYSTRVCRLVNSIRINSYPVLLCGNTGTDAYSAIHFWRMAARKDISKLASFSSAWGCLSRPSTYSV